MYLCSSNATAILSAYAQYGAGFGTAFGVSLGYVLPETSVLAGHKMQDLKNVNVMEGRAFAPNFKTRSLNIAVCSLAGAITGSVIGLIVGVAREILSYPICSFYPENGAKKTGDCPTT